MSHCPKQNQDFRNEAEFSFSLSEPKAISGCFRGAVTLRMIYINCSLGKRLSAMLKFQGLKIGTSCPCPRVIGEDTEVIIMPPNATPLLSSWKTGVVYLHWIGLHVKQSETHTVSHKADVGCPLRYYLNSSGPYGVRLRGKR